MRRIYTAAFLDRLVVQFARTRGTEASTSARESTLSDACPPESTTFSKHRKRRPREEECQTIAR